jgi:hypothetical protein
MISSQKKKILSLFKKMVEKEMKYLPGGSWNKLLTLSSGDLNITDAIALNFPSSQKNYIKKKIIHKHMMPLH